MAISDVQLDEFIQLYFDKYDVQLDRQQAYEEACKLIQLVRIVCFGKPPNTSQTNEETIDYTCQTQSNIAAINQVERKEG